MIKSMIGMKFISPKNIYKFFISRFITHKPFILTHFITYKCNLKCEKCNSNEKYSPKNELKKEEVVKVLDDAEKNGFFVYHICGGEPLLREDLPEILMYAKSKGFITYMNTNGILLKEKIEKIAPWLDYFSVSIDGSEKIHDRLRGYKGAYRRTIQGIKKAKKLGLRMKIISTLEKANINEIEKLSKLSKKLNVRMSFQIKSSIREEFTSEEYREILERFFELRRKGYRITFPNNENSKQCNYPKVFMRVDPYGNVIGCRLFRERDFSVNLKTNSFKKIFDSRIYKKLLNESSRCIQQCKLSCVSEANDIYNMNVLKIVDNTR